MAERAKAKRHEEHADWPRKNYLLDTTYPYATRHSTRVTVRETPTRRRRSGCDAQRLEPRAKTDAIILDWYYKMSNTC